MRLGLAITSGVPVLILVSMGPVAGLAGNSSVLVWTVSAVLGFFMAIAFASLAASLPHITGGIGTLAGRALAPHSRALAVTAQWSYWFGWSPALAINGVLVGTYLHDVLLPGSPAWTVVLLAVAVLGASVTVNHYGVRHGAWLHVALIACVAVPVGLLIATALARGQFQAARLLPLAPPGGWLSSHGLIAFAGGLFLAGWSAYGSELALAYGTEYRRGARDAVKTLLGIGAVIIVVYSAIPLILVGVLGTIRIQADPAVALRPLTQRASGGMTSLVVAVLVLALLLGVNMVMIGSSRTLYQLARNGDAWRFLGKVNRHGAPGNALRFDLAVNTLILIIVFALNHGRTNNVPVALLAAANVGYMLSISLALIAAWLSYRRATPGSQFLRVRPGLMHAALVLAIFNLALLLTAGFAWGWRNLLLGAGVLVAVITVFARSARRASPEAVPAVQPMCIAVGGRQRVSTTESP
ncbi:MAG: APC family permease [Nocardiopsaceae bacterium]|jgi:amino acid transporter|nr:APC family permease [Nocardiopsaceae bacterium]